MACERVETAILSVIGCGVVEEIYTLSFLTFLMTVNFFHCCFNLPPVFAST